MQGLVNVYISLPFQVQVLYNVASKLAPFMHLPLILARDFNTILDAMLDTSNPFHFPSSELLAWANCVPHGDVEMETSRVVSSSKTPRSSSQIDLAFTNSPMLQVVRSTKYLLGGLSDHTALSVNFGFPSRVRGGACRLSPGWLEVENGPIERTMSPQ